MERKRNITIFMIITSSYKKSTCLTYNSTLAWYIRNAYIHTNTLIVFLSWFVVLVFLNKFIWEKLNLITFTGYTLLRTYPDSNDPVHFVRSITRPYLRRIFFLTIKFRMQSTESKVNRRVLECLCNNRVNGIVRSLIIVDEQIMYVHPDPSTNCSSGNNHSHTPFQIQLDWLTLH